MLCFEIITLYGFIGNCNDSTGKTRVPSPSFPLLVTLEYTLKTRKLDTGIKHVDGSVIAWADLCTHHQNRDTQLFHCHKFLHVVAFRSRPHLPTPTIPDPWH